MKKADIITKINTLLTDNPDLDYDEVAEDSKVKVAELKELLADVETDIAEAAKPPTVTVAEIAKANDKDPKTVRARLRRLYEAEDADPDLPQPIDGAGNRWTFHEDLRDAVTALVVNEG